jgi:hypothetical protein
MTILQLPSTMVDAGEKPSRQLMEACFMPTTRGHDMILDLRRQAGALSMFPRRGMLTECELVPGDVLSTSNSGMAWENFCRFLWSKDMVWLTPEVYVTSRNRDILIPPSSLRNVFFITPMRDHVSYWTAEEMDDADILAGLDFSVTVHALEVAAATSACECLLGLLARSQHHYIRIGYCAEGMYSPFPIAGPALSNFFQEIHHCKITLVGSVLDEAQCRALAAVSNPDLEISLERCTLVPGDTGCQDAFIECLQRDRGPTELDRCLISNRILASALRGNSRVVKLRICGKPVPDNGGMSILFRSLTEMRGLVTLNLYDRCIVDDNWHILCESLKMHRILTCLDLRRTHRRNGPPITNAQNMHRTRAIAEVLKVNTFLHTIKLSLFQVDQNICTESVNPRLEMNRYRPRVLAVTQADNQFRRALLGRALQSQLVRNKSNLLWMFLSENADVVVASIEG